MTLGELLKGARTRATKTLREIEALTGISNGYLSQLESDAIGQPSPNHLLKLSEAYGLPYGQLMEAAGYTVPVISRASDDAHVLVRAFPSLEELTADDRQKIEAYIQDLRDARRARSPG